MSDLHALLFRRLVPYQVTVTEKDGTNFVRCDVLISRADEGTLRALIHWADDGEGRSIDYSAATGLRATELVERS